MWKAEIDGQDARGVEPRLTLDVRQGDAVRFRIHCRGNIACDTTHWDPTIAYDGGETFHASKAFGNKQGNGGWFYEMQAAAVTSPITPVIHMLGLDLSLRDTAAGSQADSLPFFVVADGERSGVVVQLESAGTWQFQSSETTDGLWRIGLTAVRYGRQASAGDPLRL